jgi:hypothetical protein
MSVSVCVRGALLSRVQSSAELILAHGSERHHPPRTPITTPCLCLRHAPLHLLDRHHVASADDLFFACGVQCAGGVDGAEKSIVVHCGVRVPARALRTQHGLTRALACHCSASASDAQMLLATHTAAMSHDASASHINFACCSRRASVHFHSLTHPPTHSLLSSFVTCEWHGSSRCSGWPGALPSGLRCGGLCTRSRC